MLGKVLRDLFVAAKEGRPAPQPVPARPAGPIASPSSERRVLNVGGGTKAIPIPAHYDGWKHLLLDIDRRGNPDIVGDARELASMAQGPFDAVYCSHNLEHYYRHDGSRVLKGFLHVLRPDGFVEIVVPDLQSVIEHVLRSSMDLGDVLYDSPAGPIAALDVLYGLGREVEQSGNDYFAHKTGFTPKLLRDELVRSGFGFVHLDLRSEAFEVRAFAFKAKPTPEHCSLLNISADGA